MVFLVMNWLWMSLPCWMEMFLLSTFFFLTYVYFPFLNVGKFYFLSFYLDYLSFLMIFLSCLITFLMFLCLDKATLKMKLPILCLFLILLIFFLTSKKSFFFIFFELSLIPVFFMILKWGYQPERLNAVFFFCIYTISFSIPFFLSLFFLKAEFFFFLEEKKLTEVWSLFLLLIFLIKLPIFFFHFWLPKAHVEAPVTGSMVLAGVLLKMGGYGVMRFFFFLKKNSSLFSLFFSISLVGAGLASIACLLCQDVKQLVAYSSVSHMNFFFMSMMESSEISFKASLMMMMVHGLGSSCLFFLCDSFYKRVCSRSLLLLKGLLNLSPVSAMWLFLSILTCSCIPPTLGSISEIMIVSSIFFKLKLFFIYIVFYMFISLFYMFHLYYSLMHGFFKNKQFFFPFSVKENIILFIHNFLSLLFIFFTDFF